MKTVKRLNFIMVLLFIAAISLPLVFADFKGGQVSVSENRYLATFPDVIKDGKLVFKPSEFDKWINDNVGGRKLATQINTKADFSLFGLSAKSDVLLGKDNWTFYYTQDILDDFTGSNLLSDKQLADITEDITGIHQYLEERGIPLFITIAPDKKTIYPEQYPSGVNAAQGMRRTQQLIEYIDEHSNVPFFSMEEALLAAKDKGFVYSPRVDNAHWNYLGGYVGYVEIIERVSAAGLDVECIPLDECVIATSQYDAMFNETVPISETWYTISNEKSGTVHLQREHLDNFPFLTFNKDPDNYKRYYVNDDQSLPSLLFIGDSYSQKLFEFVPQSFSRVMFIHSADLPTLPKILDQESFDVVVIESAERMLHFEFALFEACMDNIQREEEHAVLLERMNSLPIADHDEWGYQFVDYIGTTPSDGNVLTVNAGDATSYMEGWALDPLAGSVASNVVIQVGDRYYDAEYGKARDSVSSYFQNDAYLNSGYTINLNTQELIEAGQVAVHVISSDGSYQYPVSVYLIQVQ